MYETPDQKEPVYDAKGIETVRRDSCLAVSKVTQIYLSLLVYFLDVSSLNLQAEVCLVKDLKIINFLVAIKF